MSNHPKKIFIKIFLFSCLVLFCYPKPHVWANGIFLPEFVQGTFPLAANVQEVSKAAKEKITSDGCVFSCDPLGNLIQTKAPSSVTQFEYNTQGLLSSVIASDAKQSRNQTTNYAYDALGRRIAKDNTNYFYDGLNVAKETTDAKTTQYLSGPGTDEILGSVTNSQQNYFLSDALGSVTAITDPTRKIKEIFNFDAFGNARHCEERSDEAIPSPTPPIFAGHPLDPATGMYNARARNYDPGTGRFTTQDPLSHIPMPAIQAFAGNPYTYVRNAPTKFIDPLGLYEQPTNNAYNPYNSYSDPTPVSSWLDNNWATLSNGWDRISATPNLDWSSAKSLMFQAQYSPIESLRNSTTLLGQSLRGIYDSINASIIIGMTLDTAVAATQDVWAASGMWRVAQLFQSGEENVLDMIHKSLNSHQQPEGITPGESFVPGADYASELAKALPDLAAAANLGLLGAPGSTLTGQSPWELPGGGVMSPEEGGVGTAVPGINTPVVSTGNQGQDDREPPPGAGNPNDNNSVNVIPTTLARVVSGEGPFETLGPPGNNDVFVTTPEDIAGLNASQISQRLGIGQSDIFTIIEFPTPSEGLASPINRSDPGFVGSGQTSGGATEFVIPNQTVPENATIRTVDQK